MPCPVSLLERGAVCLALYPYGLGFPLDQILRDAEDALEAALEKQETVEDIAATIKAGDPPAEVVATIKLRHVLLLQDGTVAGRHDITVARINSVTEKKKAQGNWYAKLQSGIHPAHKLIGGSADHGTSGKEAYVDLLNVMTIRKSAILRRSGQLEPEEMQDVSELLVRTLELDLSGYLERYTPRGE